MKAPESQPVVQIQLSKRERQAIRQCEMLRGDKDGPKGRCEAFVEMTGYWNGTQLRLCGFHGRLVKRLRQEAHVSQK